MGLLQLNSLARRQAETREVPSQPNQPMNNHQSNTSNQPARGEKLDRSGKYPAKRQKKDFRTSRKRATPDPFRISGG